MQTDNQRHIVRTNCQTKGVESEEMNIRDRMQIIKESDENLLTSCTARLRHLPKSKLEAFYSGGRKYFSIWDGKRRKYLGREPNAVITGAKERKGFETLKALLEQNIRAAQTFLDEYQIITAGAIDERVKETYRPLPDDVYDFLGIDGLRDFDTERQSDYREEGLRHKSMSGIYMRSRIEVAIADIYTMKGIPFVYEEPLELFDGVAHPDFKVFVESEGRFKYHEHCGMMDLSEYRRDYIRKHRSFIESGYLPYKDVIFTFDRDGKNIDTEEISRIIDTFMS